MAYEDTPQFIFDENDPLFGTPEPSQKALELAAAFSAIEEAFKQDYREMREKLNIVYACIVTLAWDAKYKRIFICDDEDTDRHPAREGIDYDFRITRNSEMFRALMGLKIGSKGSVGKLNKKFVVESIDPSFVESDSHS